MDDGSEYDAWVNEKYPEDEYIVVHDDDDDVRPNKKFGIGLSIGVFFGIVVLSFMVVVGIMYMSRAQERAKNNRRRGE
jgi:hypothetical protein